MTASAPSLSRRAGHLHLREWAGAGLPVLLLHGMAAHTHWWDRVAGRLGAALKPAAFDFRGHGESDWKGDGVYTAETWLEDVEAARAALGWDRFLLVGHSMGARVALEYAGRHAERLLGVVAVDFLPEVRGDKNSRFSRARGRPQPVYPSAEHAVSRFRLEPDGTTLTEDELRALGAHGVRPHEHGFSWKFDWRVLTHFRLEPVWPQLAGVRGPTLVVRGEHSTILGREDYERVVAGIAGARGVELAGAHHHVPLDEPKALADAVAAFAAGLGA